MSLIPLTSASEIATARSVMLSNLRRGCRKYRRIIGWQGGNEECDLDWNPSAGFWTCADALPDRDRWIIFFGSSDPENARMLGITCEVNPPKEGINRRCAGIFVRDDADGAIYFAHSGKLGGGRAGIGKSAFRTHYRGAWETIEWPDGHESDAVFIGRIDAERFAAQVANFIQEVERFKASATGRAAASYSSAPSTNGSPEEPQFNPEFSGQRRGYRPPSEIETRCDHGLIVNALAAALRASGRQVGNDQNRDLFIPATSGRIQVLFEAKTEISTSTIYQAIGQLLYHTAHQSPPPRKVLVVPSRPNDATQRVLDGLGIETLVFDWQGVVPVFQNLNAVIER